MPDTTLDEQLKQAELDKLQLENGALRESAAASSAKRPLAERLSQVTPLVGTIIAVAGFISGVLLNSAQQQKDLDARNVQIAQDKDKAQKDLMKPWQDAQRQTYQTALTDAMQAIYSADPAIKQRAESDFWVQYHGKMVWVETTEVSDAMEAIGHCLDKTDVCDEVDLNNRSLDLSSAMASSIAMTASMTYKQFAAHQFKYLPGQSTAITGTQTNAKLKTIGEDAN